MKNKLNNALRYNTISEMKDQEIGYISEESLCFDIQDETGETIYALFHYHPYSTTYTENDYDEGEVYDIKIKCHIINNEKVFEVSNPIYKIRHEDLLNIPQRLYTVLDIEKEYINKLNAKRESLDTKDLYDAFSEFIEYTLENMEEEEHKDEAYGEAWTSFSFAITDICHTQNREDIEHILCNIYNTTINTPNGKDIILEGFSNYNSATDYMIQQLEEERFDGFIEKEIYKKIENVSSCFHELFYTEEYNFQSEPTVEIPTVEISKVLSKEELEKKLNEAIEDSDFEKAAKLRDEISKLGGEAK